MCICHSCRNLVMATVPALLLVMASSAVAGWATPRLVLGPSDNIALDQPRVAVELFSDADATQSFGPEMFNTFLLDTGATSTLAVGYAVEEMTASGYLVDGTHEEQGVAGTAWFDVSAPYRVDFAGSDGLRQTMLDQRILSNPDINFGGFHGIIGMTGMVNRVTELDMTGWSGGIDWMQPEDLYMKVHFHDAVPEPIAGTGPRYSVTANLVEFTPEGEPPLPDAAPLPFVEMTASRGTRRSTGQFVFDTGGQISIISTAMAAELGIDPEQDALAILPIEGVGGSTEMPIVPFDRLMLPTEQGVELTWTDLRIGVLDIHPALDGIFGSDLLTSGWFDAVFASGVDGYIERAHLVFTDASEGAGSLQFDLRSGLDQVLIPGDLTGDGVVGGGDLAIMLANLGQPATEAQGDLTLDGRVGMRDVSVLLRNWNSPKSPPAAFVDGTWVPEPATLALWAVAAPLLLLRRRGR